MLTKNPGAIEAVARGCNWLGYICLPLWLSPAQFGAFSFALALVLLVSAIGTAGQDRAVLRYVSAKSPSENKARISVAFITSIAFSIIAFCAVYVALECLDMHIKLPADFGWIMLWGIGQTIYMLLIAMCRSLADNTSFLILRAIFGVVKLVTLILISAFTSSAKYLVVAEAILLVIIGCIVIARFVSYITWPQGWVVWSKSLAFGLPLTLHILAGASLGQLDKLMIANMLETAALGIYAFINSVAGGVFFIFAVVNIIYEAKVYQLGVSETAEKLLKKMFLISIASAILVLLVANLSLPFVLHWLDKSEYYQMEVILLLSIAYLIYPFYLQSNIRFALKEKTKYIPMMTGTAAAANVAFNLMFIPSMGIIGAALSTLLAYIILVSLAQWTSRRI